MTTPSDFLMISWGYANIAGLLLMATSVHLVAMDRPLATGVALTMLFVTRHLSMLFAAAVLAP
jgi:hypothetical protein